MNLMRIRMLDTLADGKPLERSGNRIWEAPTMIYPCHPEGPDDYIALVLSGDSFETILAVAGRSDLIGDERFATHEGRCENSAEVEEIISGWTRTLTKREAMEILLPLGVACGMVQDTREVLDDEHLRAREMVVEMEDAAARASTLRWAIRLRLRRMMSRLNRRRCWASIQARC